METPEGVVSEFDLHAPVKKFKPVWRELVPRVALALVSHVPLHAPISAQFFFACFFVVSASQHQVQRARDVTGTKLLQRQHLVNSDGSLFDIVHVSPSMPKYDQGPKAIRTTP